MKTEKSRIERNEVWSWIRNFCEIGIRRLGDINTFRAGAKSSLCAANICRVVIKVAADDSAGIDLRRENRDSKKASNDAGNSRPGKPPLTIKIFHNNVLYTLENKIRNSWLNPN